MSVPAVGASGPSLAPVPPAMPSAAAIASGAPLPPVANRGFMGKIGNAFGAVLGTAKSAVGLSGGRRRRRRGTKRRPAKRRGTKRRGTKRSSRRSHGRKH